MSRARSFTVLAKSLTLILSLSVLLSGCIFDYLQHTDRVSYSAGDAVKANLEGQTIDPAGGSKYDTTGLGKDGVIPSGSDAPAAPGSPPAALPTAP